MFQIADESAFIIHSVGNRYTMDFIGMRNIKHLAINIPQAKMKYDIIVTYISVTIL